MDKLVGQKHLIGENGPLNKMVQNNSFSSFILYGPSGSGKTTIANYISEKINKDVYNLNATKTTKSQLEQVLKNYDNQEVVLVVDEVHRLDKQRQNLFLPYLEKENIILIGTTTENPIFTLHNAFLSRVLVFETKSVQNKDLLEFLKNLNLKDYKDNIFSDNLLKQIVMSSGGDIRKSKQYFIFLAKNYKEEEIQKEVLDQVLYANIKYESDGDRHYDLISAFQKSIRASDVNAALFYLGHLLLSGDYQIILRRLSIIAYEDIGLANFNLVNKVFNAVELFKQLGMPEGRIILANIVVELALSPKSTTAYKALDLALEDVQKNPNVQIPSDIRQNRDEKNPYIKEECFYKSNLPDEFKNKEYLKFVGDSNYEQALKQRYEKLKEQKNGKRNIPK